MAPPAPTRNKNTKKLVSNDNKTPIPMFTPNRQLTRTPPPSENTPIAGTPLTPQPDKSSTAQPKEALAAQQNKAPTAQPDRALTIQPAKAPTTQPDSEPTPSTNITVAPQNATTETPLDKAMAALNVAFTHVSEAYQKSMANLNQEEDRSRTSVEIPIYTFEEIGRKLTQAKEYLEQQKVKSIELGEYFKQLEQTLKETITTTVKEAITNTVKETITATVTHALEETTGNTTRTYASVAGTPIPEANRVREIQQQNLERKVQRRREENKFNITLTAQNADPDTKEKLAQQTHAEIAAKLQQTVESQVKENPPTIPGIQKLKSKDIRIHCETEKEADELRNLKWDEYYKGLTVRQPKYGLVVPGISTEMINPNNLQDPELVKHLEDQNKGIELKILEMKILQRKLENNAHKFSLIIFVPKPDMANKDIKHGIYCKHERFTTVEKYTPQLQLIQCYKCSQLGHHASKCRSLHHVCAKCSEHHPTDECQNETHKCALCNGEHQAWIKNCPAKIEARQNLTIRKRESSPYFDE
jgi:hypothetical protein